MLRLNALFSFFILVLLLIQPVLSQSPPSTDIFLADISNQNNQIIISNIENITNRDGYDDYPYFTTDFKKIYYTSARGEGQTDTYSYDIDKKTTECLFHSPGISEYLPVEIHSAFGRGYTVIRENKGENSHFAYMSYDAPFFSGHHSPDIAGIKAYADLGEYQHVLYFPPDIQDDIPSILKKYDCKRGETETIAENVGNYLYQRSLLGPVYFVHYESSGDSFVKQYSIANDPNRIMAVIGKIETIAPTLPGSETFCILPKNTILMSSGSKLYKYDPESDQNWHELVDLKSHGIKNITRLIVNHPDANKIAIVSTR